MPDTVTPAVRSRMMAGIRGKNTRPELQLRSALHRAGFRFRVHAKELPGRPDIVFPKRQAVLFVHGCFWHGHNCHLYRLPSTRPEFWRAKVERNRAVDDRSLAALRVQGWRVAVVWECALKGRTRLPPGAAVQRCVKWLQSGRRSMQVRGRQASARTRTRRAL